MAELEPKSTKEKRDQERATLRPLINRRPELYDEDAYTSSDYERMMALYQGSLASIDEGEIAKAKVQSVHDDVAVVDIGFKSEGTVTLEEFSDMPGLKP